MALSTWIRGPRARGVLAGLGFAALSYGAGALGALAMRGDGSPRSAWFRTRRKPWFEPPDAVFAPVWTALYGAMAYSAWRAWRQPPSPARTQSLALWGTQLALNAAWTPLFFGAHRPRAALADIVALDVAAAVYTASVARIDRGAAWTFAPYLAWLGFATALNGAIAAENP